MKRILVTGGAGFIGSNFVQYILREKQDIELLVNLDLLTYAGNLENLLPVQDDKRYRFVHGDIRDKQLVEDIFAKYEFDTVVHFAAESHVDRSILEPELFLTTNIVGTQTLLDAAKRHWKLAPDDKYITYTMDKAMYLVDETGLAQYNALKEKGFYANIMGTSAITCIYCDSINFNKETMEFKYYGRQRIERRTNILIRQLITEGKLKRVPRTENNPHGLLITNWRTLLNKDLESRAKSQF